MDTSGLCRRWVRAARGGIRLAALALVVVASVAGAATQVVSVNFGATAHAMTPAEAAGAVVVSTNWNNVSGNNGSSGNLTNSAGVLSGIGLLSSGFEGTYFARGSAGNGHESMMWGYSDNLAGSASISVSNIVADDFDVYVYFGSDGDNRTGTVGFNGAEAYYYRTFSGTRSFPTNFLQATNPGPTYSNANYAVWSNRTGTSFGLTFVRVSDNSGIHGLQIVARTSGRPVVDNEGGATGITANAAWLNGRLTSTGEAATAVSVYWGTNDAGQVASGWSGGAVALGVNTTGPTNYTTPLTGLVRGRTYYYRFYATNAIGECWAQPTAFVVDLPPMTNVISMNFGADLRPMLPTHVAGVVVAATNWNNVAGTNDAIGALQDQLGNASAITGTRVGFNAEWQDDRVSAANGDDQMIWGFLDNSINEDGLATISFAGITADDYDVYVYVGSDNPNRRGTLELFGRERYSYRTVDPGQSFPAAHIRMTDTGVGFPFGSYAVWTNLTASSFSVQIYAWEPDGAASYASGINGIQIVERRSAHAAGAPAVHPLAATGITGSGATANGVLTSTGTAGTAVWLYWGTSDAGQSKAGWSGAPVALGPVGAVPPDAALSAPLSGLTGETTYYYRFLASNAVEEVWSKAQAFTTAFVVNQYAHGMRIRFAGYSAGETLNNFPALIVLSNGTGNGAFNYGSMASPSGHDLRFFSADKSVRLNHELDWWTTNGVSYVWVQLPTLATSNDYIWAYWGNAAVAGAPAPFTTNGATWDSSVYKAVWHLNEGSGVARDSTIYHNEGTVSPGVVRGVTGQVGRAYNFDQDSNASVLFQPHAALNVPNTLSLMVWSFYNRTDYQFASWVDRRQDNSGDYGFDLENSFGQTRYYIATNALNNEFMGPGIPKQSWFLTTATYDNAFKRLYHQGGLVDTRARANGLTLNENNYPRYPLSLGKAPMVTSQGFPGVLDEVRVCATALSANYVWASYMTSGSNAAFTLYNEPSTEPAPPTGMALIVW